MPEHRTDTAATPAPDDTLRKRSLWQTLFDGAATVMASPKTCRALADALLPLICEHVEQARTGERATVLALRATQREATLLERADRAEAAIERVRKLHGPCDDGCPNCHECALAEPCPTVRALDGPEATDGTR